MILSCLLGCFRGGTTFNGTKKLQFHDQEIRREFRSLFEIVIGDNDNSLLTQRRSSLYVPRSSNWLQRSLFTKVSCFLNKFMSFYSKNSVLFCSDMCCVSRWKIVVFLYSLLDKRHYSFMKKFVPMFELLKSDVIYFLVLCVTFSLMFPVNARFMWCGNVTDSSVCNIL
jgi:hypothetical protein